MSVKCLQLIDTNKAPYCSGKAIRYVRVCMCRICGESQLEEVGAGYTFFLTGHPADGPTQAGVGFAIRTSLLHRIQNTPVGHSPRQGSAPSPLIDNI